MSNTIYLKPNQYLDSTIGSLPAGIIDKRATGIGATQCEIKDTSRSSIIVCPTRALAATKVKKHRAELNIFYKGSAYQDVDILNPEDIRQRMSRNDPIKIMVVADSLQYLLDDIGRSRAYEYFEITFDEIDSFQLDSDYRPALFKSYLEYFNFDQTKRRMISATVQEFSDPELAKEDITVIESLDNHIDGIIAIKSFSAVQPVVAQIIKSIIEDDPEKKILIAYNSIKDIKAVIDILGTEYDGKIGVLCGFKSEYKVAGLLANIDNGILSHQINFATSAYFVGYDIEEVISVIVATDVRNRQTLISTPRVRQIFGRARNGCHDRVFIFNTKPTLYRDWQYTKAFIELQVSNANRLIHLSNSELIKQTPEISRKEFFEDAVKSAFLYGHKLLFDNGRLFVNYLIVDQLLINQKSTNELYCNYKTTVNTLFRHYNIEVYGYNLSDEQIQISSVTPSDVESSISPKDILIKLIKSGGDYSISQDLPRTLSPKAKRSTKEIINLINDCEWITSVGVISYIDDNFSKENYSRDISKLRDILSVYAKPKDGELWNALYNQFDFGAKYTSREIRIGIQRAFGGLSDRSLMPHGNTDTVYKQWLNRVFLTIRAGQNSSGHNLIKIVGERWDQLTNIG